MWLTGHICGPAQSFPAGNLVQIFTFKVSFDAFNFFTTKIVFVNFVDATFLY